MFTYETCPCFRVASSKPGSLSYREYSENSEEEYGPASSRNMKQLQDYLRQAWEKNSTDTLSRLVSSMPKRLAAVIRRKGDVTS
ncbi:hypothetical protein AVEN_146837-1 [Araneus ventricosus]|uniref:Uncharacterized protein n=1 Tax=Araneus ventricosus TaxID=182803 RepID=A0A4Y2WMU2_ARAVE|nr:hypothetical protein AVEN_146837-1 [Araneus ventricosus]